MDKFDVQKIYVSGMKYQTHSDWANVDFIDIEKKVLGFWKNEHIFDKSMQIRKEMASKNVNDRQYKYVIYDGPPFANGSPHYGHILTGDAKDAFARYYTMQGKLVERRLGWDCHGLPAEMYVEKQLGIKGGKDIEKFGINKFNDACSEAVMKYTTLWIDYIERQGRWADDVNAYKTMDVSYMESVIWAFNQLYKDGLIYEAYRVMPYSWAAETPLSNFETRLDNSYRLKKSNAVTVALQLDEVPAFIKELCAKNLPNFTIGRCNLLIWTTTPWTLPSNLAVAVGEQIDYSVIAGVDTDGVGVVYITSANSVATFEPEIKKQFGKQFSVITTPKPYTLTNSRKDGYRYVMETERLYAREVVKADLPFLNEMNLDKDANKYLPSRDRFAVMQHLEFLLSCYIENGFGQWLFYDKKTNQPVGVAGPFWFSSFKDEVTIGYVIKRSSWNKGYATEIAKASVAWAFDNLDVQYVCAAAMMENIASIKVMTNVGMKLAGTIDHTDYKDPMQYYKIMRDDYISPDDKVTFKGYNLLGLSYAPLMPYYANQKNCFKVLGAEFVTTEDGTGAVHMAPGFGEDDYELCRKHNIEVVCPVDEAGKFFGLNNIQMPNIMSNNHDAEAKSEGELILNGLQVFETDARIIHYLELKRILIKQEIYEHNYPHCWRTDMPLIYKAMPSWYVKVTAIKDQMVELNQGVNWIPEHVKDGLFGKWLEGARDWSISRNRFWGCPIPVWKSDDDAYPRVDVYGSIAELEHDFGVKVVDLHRPYIDNLTRPNPNDPTGKSKMVRVKDILDCWFESGSMPFAHVHYPFENKDFPTTILPADFIVEYSAQTRGWFYTLFVMSTALFKKAPFLNCICHGTVLDDKGQKLSKRLNNYMDPNVAFEKFGADTLRWFMLSSGVMRGLDLHIDKDGECFKEATRAVIRPFWSAYTFLRTYALANNITIKSEINAVFGKSHTNILDKYIITRTKIFIEDIKKSMDTYNTQEACAVAVLFFEDLNNWYIRCSRDRFIGRSSISSDNVSSDNALSNNLGEQDKLSAHEVLHAVLYTSSMALCPLLPFIMEEIYQGLSELYSPENMMSESVHLETYPDIYVSQLSMDPNIINTTNIISQICETVYSLRSENNLRLRMPLKEVVIYLEDNHANRLVADEIFKFKDVILRESNVKSMNISYDITGVAKGVAKLDFKVIGKKYGNKVKEITGDVKSGKWTLDTDGKLIVGGIKLDAEDFNIVFEVLVQGAKVMLGSNVVIRLDSTYSKQLEVEGVARDIVRAIQQYRKDVGMKVMDYIAIQVGTNGKLAQDAIKEHGQYIKEYVYASSLHLQDSVVSDPNAKSFEVGDETIFVRISI